MLLCLAVIHFETVQHTIMIYKIWFGNLCIQTRFTGTSNNVIHGIKQIHIYTRKILKTYCTKHWRIKNLWTISQSTKHMAIDLCFASSTVWCQFLTGSMHQQALLHHSQLFFIQTQVCRSYSISSRKMR